MKPELVSNQETGESIVDIGQIEDLERRLELTRDGANVHTINKAIYHLRRFHAKGNRNMVEQMVRLTEGALVRGNWDSLKWRMRRWF